MKGLWTTVLLIAAVSAQANEVSCIPRTEVGETTFGGNIYERDDDLQIKNLSRFDFNEMTIIGAEGQTGQMVKVEKNVYKSISAQFPFYYITNDERTIVTELTVGDSATYVKILMCKPI